MATSHILDQGDRELAQILARLEWPETGNFNIRVELCYLMFDEAVPDRVDVEIAIGLIMNHRFFSTLKNLLNTHRAQLDPDFVRKLEHGSTEGAFRRLSQAISAIPASYKATFGSYTAIFDAMPMEERMAFLLRRIFDSSPPGHSSNDEVTNIQASTGGLNMH